MKIIDKLAKLVDILDDLNGIADEQMEYVDQDKKPKLFSYLEEDAWIAQDECEKMQAVIKLLRNKEPFNTKLLNNKWSKAKRAILRPKRKVLKHEGMCKWG